MVTTSSLKVPDDCTPQFSGHETFPLRQLWLPKIADFIQKRGVSYKPDFTSDEGIENAIVELGIGKNMVSSARFWARACQIIDSSDRLTKLGEIIFGSDIRAAADPYCTRSETVWLMHWNLASIPSRFTPIWYLFNHVNQPSLDRQSFVEGLKELCRVNNWKVSDNTLKRAQECVLRAYLPRLSAKGNTEDIVEPLLSELGLLETTPSRDVFLLHRGTHKTLPDRIFVYALMDYWMRLKTTSATLDFYRIAHDFGSPGRIFKLDNESIAQRLQRLDVVTNGFLEWTEQAGLKQVSRRKAALSNPHAFAMAMLEGAYSTGN